MDARRVRMAAIALGWLLVALGEGSTVRASSILDQSFDPRTGGVNSLSTVYSGVEQSQTFTVGQAGQLSAVSLLLDRTSGMTSPVTIEILGTTPGATTESGASFHPATSNVLLTETIPASAIPVGAYDFNAAFGFVKVDLGLGIPVTPGEKLAIAVIAAGNGYRSDVVWAGQSGFKTSPYPGGQDFIGQSGTPSFWSQSGWGALGFQTYVDTVPEPTAFWTLGLGLLGLLACARRLKPSKGDIR